MNPTFIPLFFLIVSGIFFVWKPNYFKNLNYPIWMIFALKVFLLFTVTSLVGWPYDVQGYFDHSRLIWRGLVPLKDFNSPYSIGFEYLMAIISLNYKTPLFMGIFILIFEFISFKIIFKNKLLSKGEIFNLSFNPLFLHFSVFDIQDEFIILFFVAWLVNLLIHNNKLYHLTLISILLIFFTKILSILFIAPLFYKNHKRGFITLFFIIVIYCVLDYFEFRIFSFEFEKEIGKSDLIWDIYSSGNIQWILKTLGIVYKPILSIFITISSFLIVNIYLAYNRSKENFNLFEYFVLSMLLNILTLLIFYKMTFPYNYIILIFVYSIANKYPTIKLKIGPNRMMALYVLVISINHQLEYLLLQYGLVDSILFYLYILLQLGIVSSNIFFFCKVFDKINSKTKITC